MLFRSGVPWRSIEWIVSKPETVEFTPEPGVKMSMVPDGTNIGRMLQEGEIDAIFRPHPPKQVLEGASDIKRLFADSKSEEARYYKKNGFYPIMHLIAFRDDVLQRYPEAAGAMMDAFAETNRISALYYDDPNWSRLAWGRLDLEEERRLLGHDLWPIGVKKNRANLERFMEYSRDQGLTKKAMAVDSLFAESVLVS